MKKKIDTCLRCPWLFSVNRNSEVIFCGKRKGKVLDAYKNKQELFSDFKNNYRPKDCKLKRVSGGNKSEVFKNETIEEKLIARKNYKYYTKPRSHYLLINYSCNNDCCFCSLGNEKRKKDPGLSSILKQIREVKERDVILFGGEPTINPHLFRIMDALLEAKKSIRITTNGVMLGNPKFAKKLLSYPLAQITISLLALNERDYNFISGRKNFNLMMAGIQNVVSHRRRSTSFRMNIVPNKKNYTSLAKMAEFADRCGVNSLRFNLLFINEENAQSGIVVDPSETVPHLIKAFEYLRKTKINWYLDNYPLCYFPPKYWARITNKRLHMEMHSNRKEVLKDGYVKSSLTEKCIDCSMKEHCPGLYGNTKKYYGDKLLDTLRPVGAGENIFVRYKRVRRPKDQSI